ncbi:MAG: rhomboid family intramembrane serine protease, partial [Bacillota bacterium]|nr:rhomboid family intramembrane serine protease [Bacillota bacterium]
MFENQKELWLEKLENKKAPIIRMLRQDLDWSNSMQRDIEIVASNGERIRKQLGRNELNVLNVYVSPYPPVDEYEFRINRPYASPEISKTTVETVLMSRQQYQPGFIRLSEVTGIPIHFSIEGNFLLEDVEKVKQDALDYAVKEINIEKALFNFGKPLFTYVFILIQVAVFLFLEAKGGSTNSMVLIRYGAKFNPLIMDGEWWRFITPIFLHIGFMHLAMNSLALYYLGTTVERIYGNARFIMIYLF